MGCLYMLYTNLLSHAASSCSSQWMSSARAVIKHLIFLSCRLPLTSSNGYTTPAPSRLSRFRWRLFLVGGPCIFLCVLFLVLRGGSQRTSNSKGSPEETYTLSVNSTCLNNSGEWIEVGINTLEPLEPDAMVCIKFPNAELLRCCCYPSPNLNPNSNSYCIVSYYLLVSVEY